VIRYGPSSTVSRIGRFFCLMVQFASLNGHFAPLPRVLAGYSRATRRGLIDSLSTRTRKAFLQTVSAGRALRLCVLGCGGGCMEVARPSSSTYQGDSWRSFCANSYGSGGKELVHVWLHCQPPWQQAVCPACQEASLCILQLWTLTLHRFCNTRVTRLAR
jgi:hypothetical protein